jgi:hypothetical protein
MSNRKYAIQILAEKGETIITCNGNSMRPLIAPGQAIHLRKAPFSKLRVGDAVFCKIKGSLTVHMIGALDEKEERAKIQNIKGFVNGWVGMNGIFGVCVRVDERVIISEEELESR